MTKLVKSFAPIIAALVYGSWAGFSNWQYELSKVFMAALVQGSFAFAATWLLTSTVTWLMARHSETPRPILVFFQCAFLLLIIPAGLHFLAGTPNIIQSMLPGFVIGNIYLAFLIKSLTAK